MRWSRALAPADFRGQQDVLSLARDDARGRFGYWLGHADKDPAVFDVTGQRLTPGEAEGLSRPRRHGPPIDAWTDAYVSTLGEARLPLRPCERSRSLPVRSESDCFVLGTRWYLRAFSAAGRELSSRPAQAHGATVPDPAWTGGSEPERRTAHKTVQAEAHNDRHDRPRCGADRR